MRKRKTARGFSSIEFKDVYDVKCSIQESSSGIKACIWIGADDIGLKEFKAGEGWKDIEFEQSVSHHFIANNRMHLSQKEVKKLIPILQKFVDTGSIY